MLDASEFEVAQTWATAWSDLGHAAPEGLRKELERAWSDLRRHYHDLRHLRECLALWKAWREQCHHGGEVALALWFHDAVYDPHASDNELKSAEGAARSLDESGIDSDAVQRVVDLILATVHDAQDSHEGLASSAAASAAASSLGGRSRAAAPTDKDLLLDIDLAESIVRLGQ